MMNASDTKMADGWSPPETMTAVVITAYGGPEVLQAVEQPTPKPAPNEVLIRVEAAGLNRGDIVQRLGFYPAPPGVPAQIPGLEVAGRIAAVGADVVGWRVGDGVCALLAGGGYAEYAVAPAVQCLPIPAGLTMVQASALPESLFTCWTNLIDDGALAAGKTVLIHGGASGIGTIGIQLAKALGATVFVTAGSADKCAACVSLGADLAINYKTEDFVEAIKAHASDHSVDVVLDMVGGDYLRRDMAVMAKFGRHISIAAQVSMDATLPIGQMMAKRLIITGSSLRGRTQAEKGALAEVIHKTVWPMIEKGQLIPPVHKAFPLAQAADAQRALDAGDHIGKIVLTTQALEV
jgi:NADPH2:quinone reductase